MLQYKFGSTWDRLRKKSNWADIRYKLLVEISQGMMNSISSAAAAEWRNPSGLADQSWYSMVNRSAGYAIIGNRQKYLYWQNFGVIAHQMRYLLNVGEKQYFAFGKYPYWGKKFIPIMKDDGEIIFRRCTEKSINAGGWWHPGYEGKQFVQKGFDQYVRTTLKKNFKDVVVRGGVIK
jgi:hypothetical protein